MEGIVSRHCVSYEGYFYPIRSSQVNNNWDEHMTACSRRLWHCAGNLRLSVLPCL
jgi:hypothetical protein